MSSLSIFPTEILECITGVVTTSQQMRLWQCGDRILNLKLQNGGLKRTSLCWPSTSWMPWPRSYFTTFGSLADVEWGVDIGRSLCPTLELKLLPKTLKRLHLACDDVFFLLLRQNVNMNEMLPLLQALHLSGSSLREKNLKNLPSNLIELHVASPGAKIKSCRTFSDLPRHIERLTLLFSISDESKLESDLPSQLISLELETLNCSFNSNWFSRLPKSLKMLKISRSVFKPDWLSLPPQLEVLVIPFNFPKSAFPQLPQSLNTLEVCTLTGDLLGLPFPKNLTRLAENSDIGRTAFNHSELQQLPVNLTDLDVTVSGTHPDIVSFYSPEAIIMRIGAGPFSTPLRGPFTLPGLNIIHFPAKLQSLELPRINDDICAKLPPGLQQLSIDSGFITTEGASKLPKSLTSLTAWFGMFANNRAMSHLAHIANLCLSVRKDTQCKLTEDWIHSLLPSYSYPANATMNDFNRNLTSLHVVERSEYEDQTALIKKPFFDALPKFLNLNKLKIFIWSFSGDLFGLIPQNVTHLEISTLTAVPTAIHLSTLPKCLRYLSIEMMTGNGNQGDWTDETLQSLPRSIQDFMINASFPNLTQNMYEYLPPNLHHFRYVTSGSKCVFFSPSDRLHRKR